MAAMSGTLEPVRFWPLRAAARPVGSYGPWGCTAGPGLPGPPGPEGPPARGSKRGICCVEAGASGSGSVRKRLSNSAGGCRSPGAPGRMP